MATDVTGTCVVCIYARADDMDPETMFCHRNAPRPDKAMNRGFWPKVNTWDWCGEFKNRKWVPAHDEKK